MPKKKLTFEEIKNLSEEEERSHWKERGRDYIEELESQGKVVITRTLIKKK